jgi:phosphate starvation-inducible PhoH-like protein
MNRHKAYDLALRDHDMLPVVAYGSAGTGKTYGACKAAVEWLERGKKQRVLVCRPNVSFAEKNGFLPGTEQEKNAPWVRPVQEHFRQFGLDYRYQENLIKNGRLTFIPLEYIQGLTFDNSFIILDEVQNMTYEQIMTFITRTGKWSKVVMCGDIAQVSPKFRGSGLAEFIDMIEYFDMPVHMLHFDRDDILRSDLCKRFIVAGEEWGKIQGK